MDSRNVGGNEGVIFNIAPTGIVSTTSDNRHIPVCHNEIVEDVAACLELGAQMFHIHARDSKQQHCADPEPYGRIIESIRRLPGGEEAIVCITTSGRLSPSFEARSRVLELDGDMKPDMASLTLSSLNFMHSASVNSPGLVRKLAAKMRENGIRPEVEIFDLGMLNFAKVLEKESLLGDVPYCNILFGNIASAQATPMQMGLLLAEVPAHWKKCIAGFGARQLSANIFGLLYADGVRVGLEDNLWFDHKGGELATNPNLLARLLRLTGELGLAPLTRADLRATLLAGTGG